MSDSGWAPVHHETLDEDTDEPGGQYDPQHKPQATKPRGGAKSEASAPVGLTLALPQQVVDAIWGAAEAQTRVALAIEENTKAVRALLERIERA